MADTGVNWNVCDSCGAEGPVADTEHEATAKWNFRFDFAQSPRERALERAALDFVHKILHHQIIEILTA